MHRTQAPEPALRDLPSSPARSRQPIFQTRARIDHRTFGARLVIEDAHFFKPTEKFIASFFSITLAQIVFKLLVAHSVDIDFTNFAAIDPKSSQFGNRALACFWCKDLGSGRNASSLWYAGGKTAPQIDGRLGREQGDERLYRRHARHGD